MSGNRRYWRDRFDEYVSSGEQERDGYLPGAEDERSDLLGKGPALPLEPLNEVR